MFEPASNYDPQVGAAEPRNRRAMKALIDLVVFGLFFVLMLALVLMTPFNKLPVIYTIPLQGIFNLTLIAFMAGWISLVRRTSVAEYIRWFRNPTFSARFLVAVGTLAALCVLVISAFLPSTGQTPLDTLLTTKTAILVFVVFGVTAAPLSEEIIFRGFLFQALSEIGGPGLAIPATAIFFALLHAGQLAGNWASVALIFLVGCILSIMRYRSNSIIPSLIVHMSYNSTLFLLFILNTLLQKVSRGS